MAKSKRNSDYEKKINEGRGSGIALFKHLLITKELKINIENGFDLNSQEHEIYRKQCLELIISNPCISRSELSHLLKSKYHSILSSSHTRCEENAPPPKNKKTDKHKNKNLNTFSLTSLFLMCKIKPQ